MMLRNHPKIVDHWPPTWSGWYGRGTKIAFGEEPEKILSVSIVGKELLLECEYEGNICNGLITIDDENFLAKLFNELENNIGISIREIGSLEIDF